MSDYIPLELLNQIIISLPVRSLMRFRLVSKQWKSLIYSPEFVADHAVHNQHAQHLLVQYRDQQDHKRKFVSIVEDDDDHSFPQQKFCLFRNSMAFQKVLPFQKFSIVEDDDDDDDSFSTTEVKDDNDDDDDDDDELRVCGSSHGLFCLFRNSMAVIWNPLIQRSESVCLPDIKKSDINISYAVGFGVCPNTLDPKIVLLKVIDRPQTVSRMLGRFGESDNWQVKIFSLTSGTWRNPFNNDQLSEWIKFKYPNSLVVIDGFIYWFASRSIPLSCRYPLIVSFNLTSEKFDVIRFPDRLMHFQRNKDFSVHKIREAVGVLQCETMSDKRVIEAWMLKNHESKSYKKLFTVNIPYASVWRVIGIRKTDQLITEKGGKVDSAMLAVYDRTPPHNKNLGIYGCYYSFSVSSYRESLLLLDHKGALGNNEVDNHVARFRKYKETWFGTRLQGKAEFAGQEWRKEESTSH